MRRTRYARAARVSCLVLLGAAAGCEGADRQARLEVPAARELGAAELAEGEALFERFCVECHAPAATGTDRGPPLVHQIYEPRHHSDFAFLLAIRQGVRAHHWRFGDMPPVEGITTEEAQLVIGYIRHLQRRAGVF